MMKRVNNIFHMGVEAPIYNLNSQRDYETTELIIPKVNRTSIGPSGIYMRRTMALTGNWDEQKSFDIDVS